MSKNLGKAFCVLPWLHSFVNIGGEYQVCCTAEEFHTGIPDELGKNLNIKNRPSLSEVMNSDFMKQLRLDMLDGKRPALCTRCIITEDTGGVSRRIIENRKYAPVVETLIETTQVNGMIPLNIKSSDYRLGNTCNLQCRMCNARSSVMWLKDSNEFKAHSEFIDADLMQEYSNYNWIDEDYLLDEFEQKVMGIEHLHFAGGEPLIAPKMREMLQICIDRGVAKKISLTYNTNITMLPPKVLTLWKDFKEVRLLCSVDGYGKVNDYIRMPSKWEVIDKNLTFLDQHAVELNLTDIVLSTTVQAYNILNLNELFLYLKKFTHIKCVPNLVVLYSPDYLMTQVLPAELKAEATKRLLALLPELDEARLKGKDYLIDNIQQVLNFMNKKDLHSSHWKEFKAYNERIDGKNGMSLKECIPELFEAL